MKYFWARQRGLAEDNGDNSGGPGDGLCSIRATSGGTRGHEAVPQELYILVLQLGFQCRCRPLKMRMHTQVPTLRKQAEEEIQRFRYLPKPINVCQYILEHSGSLGARFQASTPLP